MPSPHKNEPKDEFISRCMGDSESNKTFPDQSQWERKDKKKSLNPTTLAQMANKLANDKWLINPTVHTKLCKQLNGHMENPIELDESNNNDEEIHYDHSTELIQNAHALIYINGIISKNVSPEAEVLLGLCDVDWIKNTLNEAANDPSISDIICCYNSPGGETTGIEELGRRIVEIDTKIKPVYTWCENQMDSAAYWLGSQARTVGMMTSSQVGGIGVYLLVLDETQKMKQDGCKIVPISSGKYKLLGHEFVELKPDETKILQNSVNKQHEKFNKVVLSRRPDMSPDDMEGLSYNGEEALEKHFTDMLCDSLEEFLSTIEKQDTIYNSNITKNNDMKPQMEKVPNKLSLVIEKMKKLMGEYDGGYAGAPDDNKNDNFVSVKKENSNEPVKIDTTKAETEPIVKPEKDDSKEKLLEEIHGMLKALSESKENKSEEEEKETIPPTKMEDEKRDDKKEEKPTGGVGDYDSGYSGPTDKDNTGNFAPDKISAEGLSKQHVDMSVFFGPRAETKSNRMMEILNKAHEETLEQLKAKK